MTTTTLRLALALTLSACGGTPQTSTGDVRGPGPSDTAPGGRADAIGRPDRLPADVVPRRYELALDIDPRQERFRGEVTIEVDLGLRHRDIYLHGKNLHVTEASVGVPSSGVEHAEWIVADEARGLAVMR